MKVNGTNLKMIRGDSESIILSLKENGKESNFESGDIVYLTVKKQATDEEIVMQKIITNFNETRDCVIEIEPSDTKNMSFTSYVYDIQLTRLNGRVTTIVPYSKFIVSEEVTYD